MSHREISHQFQLGSQLNPVSVKLEQKKYPPVQDFRAGKNFHVRFTQTESWSVCLCGSQLLAQNLFPIVFYISKFQRLNSYVFPFSSSSLSNCQLRQYQKLELSPQLNSDGDRRSNREKPAAVEDAAVHFRIYRRCFRCLPVSEVGAFSKFRRHWRRNFRICR